MLIKIVIECVCCPIMNVIAGLKMRPNGTGLICVQCVCMYGLELEVINGVSEHFCCFCVCFESFNRLSTPVVLSINTVNFLSIHPSIFFLLNTYRMETFFFFFF